MWSAETDVHLAVGRLASSSALMALIAAVMAIRLRAAAAALKAAKLQPAASPG